MQHYQEMRRLERDGFEVIVDRTYEHCAVRDMFDETCHDIKDLETKVNNGYYEWFILRARVMLNGHELGNHTVGACLYEDPMTVFDDGTAEDVIHAAMKEAKAAAVSLRAALAALGEKA